jgi:hypothetical protein
LIPERGLDSYKKLKNYIQKLLDSDDPKISANANSAVAHEILSDENNSEQDELIDIPVPKWNPDFKSRREPVPISDHSDLDRHPIPVSLWDGYAADKEKNTANIVQLFDTVTYLLVKNGVEKEKRVVQIVPTQGDSNTGTISQHSVIGRILLGAYEGEKIDCTLPIGPVLLTVFNVDKCSEIVCS